MRTLLIAAALAVAVTRSAAAADCFAPAEAGRVAGHDGFASLRLENGPEVRLADIVPAFVGTAAPLRDGTIDAALGALIGEEVTVRRSVNAPQSDRYGRVVGDLVRKDTAASVVHELLRQGLALVDPAVMSETCLDALFAQERQAERAGRGFWQSGAVRDAGDPELADAAGSYTLVEGVVKSIGETRGAIYLNFGETYRTDFTAIVRRRDAKDWIGGLMGLKGRKVRLRGVLEAWNGALIRLEHPRQVERL
ncbi:MAG: thermonuclease family protein [Pseudomonadota bacterium]